MRLRTSVLSSLALVLAGIMTFSLLRGQDQTAPPAPPPVSAEDLGRPRIEDRGSRIEDRGSRIENGAILDPRSSILDPRRRPARDFSKLNRLQNEMLQSGQRAADWLFRVNGVKGRFRYGYLPALQIEMEGDHYLRQAGAAFALARAARFLGEERYAIRATQAILTLLDETIVGPADPQCRCTALPSVVVNRLGAAGLLVLAISELPAPQKDLLEKSEQLCNYIHRQVRPDGSLRCQDAPLDGEGKGVAEADDPDSVNEYPGLALYALLRSQQQKPAAWKMEVVRKAAAYYRPWWQAHRSLAFVPWQTAAYSEAFLQTKEPAFAAFVFEMNDWLCGLQYDHLDPRRMGWLGGFKGWADGRIVETAPDVGSAVGAESLAEACRAARLASDVTRHQRYTETLERALQFLVRLQYADANVQHFAEWYRPRLVGAFHASLQDGNLRLDYTQHPLSALLTYLEEVSPPP